jgi:hypothetical protein
MNLNDITGDPKFINPLPAPKGSLYQLPPQDSNASITQRARVNGRTLYLHPTEDEPSSMQQRSRIQNQASKVSRGSSRVAIQIDLQERAKSGTNLLERRDSFV